MTFSKLRAALGRSKSGPVELLRFATDGGSYPGIANRLFKAFVDEYNPEEIISYADRRWATGWLYEILGFEHVRNTDVNYWYIDCNLVRRFHRYLFRKDKIKSMFPDAEGDTEREIMNNLGFWRIYDCGSMLRRWTPRH